jgi:SAM-dependent methyltransferase
MREKFRERYWTEKDPVAGDRLLWRAQTCRHLAHLLPGQSILELGCGQGRFTSKLWRVSRGENPITAVTFIPAAARPVDLPPPVGFAAIADSPSIVDGQSFDVIVGMDLLDAPDSPWILQRAMEWLKPGGQLIFYESNPWNAVLRMRRFISRLVGQSDPRRLLSRQDMYELLSEIGFVRVFAVYNDFVYAPLSPSLVWALRNLSIVLENMPYVRTLAGSILVHAQKPPRHVPRPVMSLFRHDSLHRAISVVIPCHNEEMNVEPLVTQLLAYYGDYIHEIIPVDDNSQDNTARIISELAAKEPRIRPVFRTPPNGVGRALADGFAVATGRYILTMDCDFQQLLPELRDLFDAADAGYDLVCGSRFSRHGVLLNYPWKKIVANRGFHALAQLLFRRRFRDLTNNLKLIRREVIEQLALTQPGFAVNAETGLQPLLMGYKVKEVPISWINRTPDMGVSSFRLAKVGGGYWQVLFTLWRATRFGTRLLPRKMAEKSGLVTLKETG